MEMSKKSLIGFVAIAIFAVVLHQLWTFHRRESDAAYLRGALAGQIVQIGAASKGLELLDSNDLAALRDSIETSLMISAIQAQTSLEAGVRPELIGSPEIQGLKRASEYAASHRLKGDPEPWLDWIRDVYLSLWNEFDDH
jgi:hypothetical protein